MHRWTRGEKIAAWTLAVGILSCPILYQLPFVRQMFIGVNKNSPEPDTDQDAGSQRKEPTGDNEAQSIPPALEFFQDSEPEGPIATLQALAKAIQIRARAEASIERERAIHLHEERIRLRRNRIAEMAKELHSPYGSTFCTISFGNCCKKSTINVAMSYMDLGGKWMTRGWWTVKSGEIRQTDVMTTNSSLYFFATPVQPHLGTWNGSGQVGSKSLLIAPYERFDQFEGEPFFYESAEEVIFFMRTIDVNWGNYVQWFDCP